jgi:HAD superfamily hydrolase (TIGR01509 family)
MDWIRNFDLFLFDFDGLLVDTETLHFQAYVNMLAKRGLRLDWGFSKFCSTAHLNANALREALYAEFPNLDPDWKSLYEEKKACYLDLLLAGKVRLMKGVEPLLKELEKKKVRRACVTNSLLEQTKLIRSQIPALETIPLWITREDYEKPKPSPECYLKAIELVGKKGDRIIGFEDSARGIEALKGTPALPILICQGDHPLLEAIGGAAHYESIDQVFQ